MICCNTSATCCPASAKTRTTRPGIGETTRPVDSAAPAADLRAPSPLGLVTASSYLFGHIITLTGPWVAGLSGSSVFGLGRFKRAWFGRGCGE